MKTDHRPAEVDALFAGRRSPRLEAPPQHAVSVYLREPDTERIEGIVPQHDGSVLAQEVGQGNALSQSKSLCQNGLRKVCISDRAGFWPLPYTATSGSCDVIKSLLGKRAQRT